MSNIDNNNNNNNKNSNNNSKSKITDQVNTFTNLIRLPVLSTLNPISNNSNNSNNNNKMQGGGGIGGIVKRENIRIFNSNTKNRHTIAANEPLPVQAQQPINVENFGDAYNLNYSNKPKQQNQLFQQPFNASFDEHSNEPSSKKTSSIITSVVGNISSGVGTGSIGTLADSDHDLCESSVTGFSSNGLDDDDPDSYNDDPDSYTTGSSGIGGAAGGSLLGHNYNHQANINDDLIDDNTTKRLKSFVATTLHNEIIYLEKLNKLLSFKTYLEKNFAGSLADINVLFSGIHQIYTTHDIVASKLQEYSTSLSEFFAKKNFNEITANSGSNIISISSSNISNLNPSKQQQSTNNLMKEQFLSNALQLLANIMEISFPVYLEFLKNYPKSMTILNELENPASSNIINNNNNNKNNQYKSKSFSECQFEFNRLLQQSELIKNETNNLKDKKVNLSRLTTDVRLENTVKDPYSIYYNDGSKSKVQEKYFDLTKIFAEEILRRPIKLFEFICSLKDECIRASNELTNNSYSHCLQANIKSLFENESSKSLRDRVFDEINRNIMPKQVRKNEDVVELIESNNEKRIRHLILYGDCLVCCKTKKEKRHLKWFIPIDQLEIRLDVYKTDNSDSDLRHLRQLKDEVVSLRKKQTEDASARNQQKIKKKLAEQENELTIQSSRLKLIVRCNPSLLSQTFNSTSSPSSSTINQSNTSLSSSASSSHSSSHTNHNSTNSSPHFNIPLTSISLSMSNLTNLTNLNQKTFSNNNSNSNYHYNHNPHNSININNHYNGSHNNSPLATANNSSSNNNTNINNITSVNSTSNHSPNLSSLNNHYNQYIILFTSDFERIAWLEEINGAIYAFKARKTTVSIQSSEIESRINFLRKIEEPPNAVTSSYTGSLELLIKHIEEINQPNKLFVAVELKSCGSYLKVAETRCSDLTTNPIWNEKFNLELQSVDSLRIILYCQTSDKALAISSQELKIDTIVNSNKLNCVKLDNSITIHLSMKFLSPKKTITRRKTRNRNDIFGGNLSDLLQREKSTIPRILKDCVEIIEGKGIDEVGIYRVSSVVSEVQKMKDLYSKNPNQAHAELKLKTPHLSANLLKLYLRELPDPLFTSYLYHRFMSALDCSISEFRMSELCRVFNELPDPNKTILLFVLTHLLNIASHSDKNKMDLQNLCTLFGPTLMKLSPNYNLQVDDMAKEINESMQQAKVLFYILQLHQDDKLIPSLENETEKSVNTDKNNNSNNLISGTVNKTIQQQQQQNQPSLFTSSPLTQNKLDKNNNNLSKLNINNSNELNFKQQLQQQKILNSNGFDSISSTKPTKTNMQTTL